MGPVVDALLRGAVPFRLEAGSSAPVNRIFVAASSRALISALRFQPSDDGSARFSPTMSKNNALVVLNLHPRHRADALREWPTEPVLRQDRSTAGHRAPSRRRHLPVEVAARLGVGAAMARRA